MRRYRPRPGRPTCPGLMLGKLMLGTLMFGTSMMSGTVDVRDVKVDVAGHAWHLEATFGGAPPPTRWPTGLRAGPSPGTRVSTARPCRPTSRSPTCPDHPAFAKYRSLPPGVG